MARAACLALVVLFLGGGPSEPGRPAALWADEPYSGPDGFAVVVLKSLEKSGVLSVTWGGTFEVPWYNPGENCDLNAGDCYEPVTRSVEFKVSGENPVVLNFLQANQGREMFVRYNLPMFGDDWQVIDAAEWAKNPPRGLPTSIQVKPTGSKTNLVVYGRILRLQREGTFQNIWEGLYLDQSKRKVLPISITSDAVATYLEKAMSAREVYYMGISVSYVPGFRNSAQDIFEINYVSRPVLPQ